MKFLIDNALSPQVAAALTAMGHDAVHVREIDMQAADDEQILLRAEAEERVIVSADTDFGTLLAQRRSVRPSFILFRGHVNRDPCAQASLLKANLEQLNESLESGAVVVIDDQRVRVRRLPIKN